MVQENQITFSEAPASLNFRFITPTGFITLLTIRGHSGYEVLQKAEAALQELVENGCKPYPVVPMNNNQENTNGTAWCKIHGVAMRQYNKNGKSWYSHSTEEGWCNGK